MKDNRSKLKIVIKEDWCKGCGICIEFCPKKVLVLNEKGKSSMADDASCIRCGQCEMRCPDFAIYLKEVNCD